MRFNALCCFVFAKKSLPGGPQGGLRACRGPRNPTADPGTPINALVRGLLRRQKWDVCANICPKTKKKQIASKLLPNLEKAYIRMP